jgi:hypothetical protein
MFHIHPEAIKVFVRLNVRTPNFEVSPMSVEFDTAQTQEPSGDNRQLVHRVVNEIEKTVGELVSVFGLQKLNYKFWSDRDRIVQDCAGVIVVPWKYKMMIQSRLIWKGYFYNQAKEISCVDPLLEPFEDKGQRYWADFSLDHLYSSITDRQDGKVYDPRALLDPGSAEYTNHQSAAVVNNTPIIDPRVIVSDLGGIERTCALLFFRLRCASGEYSLSEVRSSLLALGVHDLPAYSSWPAYR